MSVARNEHANGDEDFGAQRKHIIVRFGCVLPKNCDEAIVPSVKLGKKIGLARQSRRCSVIGVQNPCIILALPILALAGASFVDKPSRGTRRVNDVASLIEVGQNVLRKLGLSLAYGFRP